MRHLVVGLAFLGAAALLSAGCASRDPGPANAADTIVFDEFQAFEG